MAFSSALNECRNVSASLRSSAEVLQVSSRAAPDCITMSKPPAIGPRLPLADYLSTTSFLAFLLTTNIAFLPRSNSYFQHVAPLAQRSSADRPEHPFLTPLTSNPLGTILWWLLGDGIVMSWWGTTLRRWWYPLSRPSKGQDRSEAAGGKEEPLERSRKVAGPAIVSYPSLFDL